MRIKIRKKFELYDEYGDGLYLYDVDGYTFINLPSALTYKRQLLQSKKIPQIQVNLMTDDELDDARLFMIKKFSTENICDMNNTLLYTIKLYEENEKNDRSRTDE